MQQTYHFKTIVPSLLTIGKMILKKRAKFRIIIYKDKYYSQEFYGFWKIGFYFNFGYYKGIPQEIYKHDIIEEAEEAINQAIKESKSNKKTYIVKEYI